MLLLVLTAPAPAPVHVGMGVGQTLIVRPLASQPWERSPPPQAPCLARGRGRAGRRQQEDGDHRVPCLLAALGGWLCRCRPDLPPALLSWPLRRARHGPLTPAGW